MAKEPDKKKSAKSNKAADLNTAVTWLISQDIGDLPDDIKNAAIQLRNAINDEEIERIELWYVHNLNESKNCEDELKAVEKTLDGLLKRYYPSRNINISSTEVGEKTLNEWYQTIKTPILVDDDITLNIEGGFERTTENWSSFSTYLECRVLYDLYKLHKQKIFSANIRDFLGMKKTDSNINYGIRKTIEDEPGNFWIYNNGITVVTHTFDYKKDENKLHVKGFSIVNGAQTTGSIGTLSAVPKPDALVPVRFIKCSDQQIISNVVRFNNSQNKITAADFRSNDRIQEKLRNEFASIRNVLYTGGRRGGSETAIARNPYLIPSDSVAQALSAFHQDPTTAYNKKSQIWISDRMYSTIFNEKITAYHIIFVYSLFLEIMEYKANMWKRFRGKEELIDTEKDSLAFLRMRGANYMLMSAISACLEVIIAKPISDRFSLRFVQDKSPFELKANWKPIIESLISFSDQISKPTESSLKSEAEIKACISTFKSLVTATVKSNQQIYRDFAGKIKM
jgi:hypothetical protein